MSDFNLGIVTAYGYAKSKGYTGTEEEFAALMASYADVAEQAAQSAQDASQSAQDAESAKQDILSATVTVTPSINNGNLTFNAAIEGGD